jgi:hypothetical protein
LRWESKFRDQNLSTAENVSWMFAQFAGVVSCGFCIRGLLVVLVREECPSIVKFGQVENFVSPLLHSSLIEIDKL